MYQNNPFGGDFLALGIGIILLYLILIAGVFVLITLYFKSMIDVMTFVRPKNRETGTSNIIFMFIPLFSLIYGFIVYPKICDSIKNEYKTLGLAEDGDFGRGLSIAMCALTFGNLIPLLNILTGLAGLVIWIIFWVKIHGYKEVLMQKNGNGFSDEKSLAMTNNKDLLD